MSPRLSTLLFVLCATATAGCSDANFTLGAAEWDDAAPLDPDAIAETSDSLETSEAGDVLALETDGALGPETSVPDTAAPDILAPDAVTPDTSKDASSLEAAADTYAPPDTNVAADTSTPDTADSALRCPVIQGCFGSIPGYTCEAAELVGRRLVAGPGSLWSSERFSTTPVPPITDGVAGCPALGPDRAYRLFMRRGETVTVTISTSPASTGTYQSMFWESRSCTTHVCSGPYFQCGSSAGASPTSSSHVATSDGWVTIVVAGRSASDVGQYDLRIRLSDCAESLCECG